MDIDILEARRKEAEFLRITLMSQIDRKTVGDLIDASGASQQWMSAVSNLMGSIMYLVECHPHLTHHERTMISSVICAIIMATVSDGSNSSGETIN